MKRLGWLPVILIVVSVLVSPVIPAGLAQQFPSRPIEFVVPFAAGGGSDLLARAIARMLQEEKLLPVPIVVVNKPGGSGAVGYTYLASKRGDPHHIATVSSSFWTTPLVGQSPVSYRDFTALYGLAFDTFLLVTRTESTFRRMSDVVAVAKQRPGLVSVSGSAIASDDAVVTYMLEREAGIKLNYISFGGSGPALVAALGGHVILTWSNPGEVLPQLEARKARALAVASAKRLAGLPDVPTFKELGYNVDFAQFRGVVMPPNVQADAVRILADAVGRLCRSRRWQNDYVEKNMITGVCMRPDEFGRAVAAQHELYRKVFAGLGVIK
ncbi:MAG: tripartite tricarboxylate transporter substrate binding protein [Armatimonadetes bacterium]|nr:tripartite tricarboxylate transporter substrate binding protein [Armatimonadota bacterium]